MSKMLNALLKEKGGLCEETKYLDVCMEWIRAGGGDE